MARRLAGRFHAAMTGRALSRHIGKIFLILVTISTSDAIMPAHQRKSSTRVIKNFGKIGRERGPG